MKYYQVDLLTPDKVIAQGITAESIKVDTIRGEINILPEHTHLITSLFTGLLIVKDQEGKSHHFTVSKGICKVLGDRITILSSNSLTPSDVKKDLLESEIKSIEERLQKTDLMNDDQIESLYEKLDYNNSALKLLNFI